MINEQEIIRELALILNKTTNTEKHRGYHILPERLNALIKDENLVRKPVFYEKERMAYIKSYVDFRNKSVLDIGCNVGYFLFGALDEGAAQAEGYEGKTLCSEFALRAIDLLGEKKRFKYYSSYFDFSMPDQKYDIILLLNVLHHIGDDYDDKTLTINQAKQKIIKQINDLSGNTSTLIYQMGFNWKGNIKQCLFENGLKAEMIDYLKEGTNNCWDTAAVGIAGKKNGNVIYKDLNDENIVRDDSLGEFLNRPLFIFKSKRYE